MTGPHRYRSPDEDSGRWTGFPFRAGDIVISTRSKSGTTWMQMICLLLVFGRGDLPAPLAELSPWLDWLVRPRQEVVEYLEAQTHRRVIKTHTPLDGVPIDGRATYIVVGRHPLDLAVSLYHHADNLDRGRMAELIGAPMPTAMPRLPLHQWLVAWVRADPDPRERLDSLSGVLWHTADAWNRRHSDNVILLHYRELSTDLEAVMRRLADRLRIDVDRERWPELVEAATFGAMRAEAGRSVPDRQGVLKDPQVFFRRGSSGEGLEVLSQTERDEYAARVAGRIDADALAWLHGEHV
ncbi:MAG TPA: sulfotransferase domain-containing protein [Acidimicrobiales bacterium]|jgi:hypothetical protein